MVKKDINQINDSFFEAAKIVSKKSENKALLFLNNIINTECKDSVEEAYFRSVAYYVQNKGQRIRMMYLAKSNK